MIDRDPFEDYAHSLTHIQTLQIAYSGGLDSHVLLHYFHHFLKNNPHYSFSLCAIHVNHGLNPNAKNWERHCQQICETLSIPLEIVMVNAKPQHGESPEEAAREARYEVFQHLVDEKTCLLTAHQQDDQAETVLLQLFRGAGPKGLAAMPTMMNFSKGFHWRPFLHFSREQLQTYAEYHALNWIEDDSNQHLRFDRNFLRHDILPLLKKRWPQLLKTISRSAKHCASANHLLEEVASLDYQEIQNQHFQTLSIKKLVMLSRARQQNVLRYWLQKLNLPLPSTVKIEKIIDNVVNCRMDAKPIVHWKNVEVRRYRDNLFALPALSSFPSDLELSWNFLEPLNLPKNMGKLIAIPSSEGIFSLKYFDHLCVRFRQGGERCQLAGKSHHQSLKKLMQEWKVPIWLRDRVPLLYHQDELVGIVGYGVCAAYAAKNVDEEKWDIKLL